MKPTQQPAGGPGKTAANDTLLFNLAKQSKYEPEYLEWLLAEFPLTEMDDISNDADTLISKLLSCAGTLDSRELGALYRYYRLSLVLRDIAEGC